MKKKTYNFLSESSFCKEWVAIYLLYSSHFINSPCQSAAFVVWFAYAVYLHCILANWICFYTAEGESFVFNAWEKKTLKKKTNAIQLLGYVWLIFSAAHIHISPMFNQLSLPSQVQREEDI